MESTGNRVTLNCLSEESSWTICLEQSYLLALRGALEDFVKIPGPS